MAVVQGIKEKVHLPIYDCVRVKSEKQLGEEERSNTWKFFVDVQGKTKLETNLQAASLLPHYNTFEARAMRVVISDLPAIYPDDDKGPKVSGDELEVQDDNDPPNYLKADGTSAGQVADDGVTADIEMSLAQAMKLLEKARESEDKTVDIPVDDEDVTVDLKPSENAKNATPDEEKIAGAGGAITLSVDDLVTFIEDLKEDAPAAEQIKPHNGAGTLVGKVVYNTVTSLYVGEKVMIEMPTWFFPGGAGPYSETGKFTTHGEPSPISTFKFAEPIYIDKNQNFRVEMEIPDSDVLTDLKKIYGPFFIWVVLDGFMTRDVQ